MQHYFDISHLISSHRIPMAELCSSSFVFTTIVLLLSCHHTGSLLSPTSTSTITFLSKHNNVTDRQALVSFKSMISNDPRRSLASWNDSVHFCQWPGVTCGGRWHPQRVVSLNLSSLDLAGFISPAITNLTFLKKIDLSNNQIHGSIPEEIGRLFRLQLLDFTMNFLEGGIPASLSRCSQLQVLSMRQNMLRGEIPLELGNCLDLQVIRLSRNNLTGRIPPSLANLSSLYFLDLYHNSLSGGIPPSVGSLFSLAFLDLSDNQLSGSIPPSLGKLYKLKELYLFKDNLSGVIPSSLWNLSSLTHLDMPLNSLSGSLPPNVGQTLPLLEEFALDGNQFHGPIPTSLSNASRLGLVDLSQNRFHGIIPPNLGSLQNLYWLNLQLNHLEAREPEGWKFFTSLTNCSHLKYLMLDFNNLRGFLPVSIANLSSNLERLTMTSNYISGKISPDIGNLLNLKVFDMGPNFLSGSIPASIGMLQKLHTLDLHGNKLSGEIPSAIGRLTQLFSLYLGFNELSGKIPASLGNCRKLQILSLKFNKLTGTIPKEVLTISTLTKGLDLSYNSLTGLIPAEIGSLINLGILDFRMNNLSGEIPDTLSKCQVLENLYLGGNFLQGTIPDSLRSSRNIREIDVSKNNLSGKIPDFLQELQGLNYLNLSFNNFEGEVPRLGVFENASAVLVIGNSKLCGGNQEMHLPACPSQSQSKKYNSHTLAVIIGISSSFLFLVVLLCFLVSRCWKKWSKRKPHSSTPIKEQHVKVSYAELAKATNGFSSENIIGGGGFGTVYRAILDEDSMKFVAVKVLNLQARGASKSFIAECEALRNIRHRNLLKILTICSSQDFKGNDFKALVFEFMANGSLDDWLHPRENEQFEPKKLNLMQRLNIAIDVAFALDYLHHQGETPIIHCDLKPSNILLGDDMTAYVGDFSLTKFVKKISSKSSQYSTGSVGLKGTVGYIAPEYGVANKVSTLGDVYSYGILLLEIFTSKRPTDDSFIGGVGIREFVEMAFPERITDVIDSQLLLQEDGEANDDDDDDGKMNEARVIECIASVLRIGISCSNEVPAERMEMGEITRELLRVRDAFFK